MKKYYIAFFPIAAALAITPAALADTFYVRKFQRRGSAAELAVRCYHCYLILAEITNITGNFTDTHTGAGAITDPFPARP